MDILNAVLVLGALGLVLGLLLALASKYLSVQQDERIELITQALPAANCGGCGYPGCGALAVAIVENKAAVNACPVGGAACAEKIAEIMGLEKGAVEEKVAMVLCAGVKSAAKNKFEYDGVEDCTAASLLAGGERACLYGCIGLGSCERKCVFDAIKVVDGVAVVDHEKCTACGVCVATCPKDIIKLIPKDKAYTVACSSKDKGSAMKNICTVGCIACRLCEKVCPTEAITVEDNLASIDYEKCINCGQCEQKCPKKIIHVKAELLNISNFERNGCQIKDKVV